MSTVFPHTNDLFFEGLPAQVDPAKPAGQRKKIGEQAVAGGGYGMLNTALAAQVQTEGDDELRATSSGGDYLRGLWGNDREALI